MAKTASDIMMERLVDWGVDTIFGLPGDGINGLFEALRTHKDKIKFIQVRHEEAAAFAACSYAKFTGRLGVCLATSGPGAIHLLNGLYDAKMDGAPVLALTGQQYSDLLGSHYQQEVNLLALYEDVAAYNQQVQGSSDVYNLVNTACRVALSQRTVAHITFPIDYQVEAGKEQFYAEPGGPARSANDVSQYAPGFYVTNGHNGNGHAQMQPTAPAPGAEQLQKAAAILNAGQKVAILAGHGAIHARAELEQLADLLAAPVVKPLLGKSAISDDSPFSMGGLGLLGTRPSEDVMEQCDTLLIIGSSYPYPSYLPKPSQARGVQIEIDQARVGLRFPVEVGLVGDSRATLLALLPLLQRKSDRGFLEMAQQGMRDWNRVIEMEGTRMDVPMKPQVVAHALNKYAASNAIVCGDSGANTTWIARNFYCTGERMFSCSGNLATMAPGLPYAVGAAVAHPDRQVIAFQGDGGFTMLMGEMITAVKYNLPIKVILMNNHYLAQIKWEQTVFLGNPEYGVDLQPADFAAWARAAGAQGIRVEDPTKIDQVMQEFLALPGPAVLDCIVDPDEPPLPAKIKPEQALHFAQALAKGTPQGPRLALTAFRDKIDQILADQEGKGIVGKAMEKIGDALS
ncbi:MAG TPA: thiamine pyrophosphate-dependent enzyme [Ktedonobacterales bacterium]|nr:thiamine pyrophosphate-dependent enzyme [Ktedonobacterales bacterium]